MGNASAAETSAVQLKFDDPKVLQELYGVEDAHLRLLEREFKIQVSARGQQVMLQGRSDAVRQAESILQQMYAILCAGQPVGKADLKRFVRLSASAPETNFQEVFGETIQVPARGRMVRAHSAGQRSYIEAIRRADMVFGIGPAGTGKTYLAMAMAVESLMQRRHERIILCRPAVEAGEKLGFLPGSMQEKVNPYLRPLYDALHDMMDFEQARRMIEDGTIEVAPLAFMRGRTLANSFVILDEGQNCTPEQMKMFLTRLGERSKAVITGDITQIDLPGAVASGLVEAVRILHDVDGIRIHYLSDVDVVRHPLVAAIIRTYERRGGSGV